MNLKEIMKDPIGALNGRMGRGDFSFSLIIIYAFGWVLSIPVLIVMAFLPVDFDNLGATFFTAWTIGTFIPKAWCCIRRCHDCNRSGFAITLVLCGLAILSIVNKYGGLSFLDDVPIEVVVIPLIYIFLANMHGDEKANNYGEIPYDDYTKHLFNNQSRQESSYEPLRYTDEEIEEWSNRTKVGKSEREGKKYIINEDGSVTFKNRN